MDINDLLSVVTVYRLHSFSEAAFQLSYTSSAISKHVRRVEEELGFSVFIRGDKQRQATLTSEGAAVLPLMQSIVDKHAEMMELSLSLRAVGSCASLRVGFPYLFSTFGEAEMLAAFSAQNPGTGIEYTRSDGNLLIQAVAENRLDCAFIFIPGAFSPEKFLAKHNYSALNMIPCNKMHGMYVGVADSDPLAGRESVSMAEIIDRTFAFRLSIPSSDPIPSNIEAELMPTYRSMLTYMAYCSSNGITPKVRYFNVMSHTVFQLAAAGELIIPVMAVGYTYSGIRFVRVSDWDNTGYLYYVTRRNAGSLALKQLGRIVEKFAAENLNDDESTDGK